MDLNSITLLSFALGIILILAAVIGKEIKIAAIELPAVSEKLPRLFLAITGVALIYFSIFDPFQLTHKDPEPTDLAIASSTGEAAESVATTIIPTNASVSTPLENGILEVNGYYLLQTKLLEAENKCLEGNNIGGDIGGAAFMQDCTNPTTGQVWKLIPLGDGYYILQTKLLEAENKCLEGNNIGGDIGGAAFMNDCTNPTTGQAWKLIPLSDGYYLLQTKLLEAENKCLEGNNIGGDMGGGAFMQNCTNPSTGQVWKLIPVP